MGQGREEGRRRVSMAKTSVDRRDGRAESTGSNFGCCARKAPHSAFTSNFVAAEPVIPLGRFRPLSGGHSPASRAKSV